MNKTVTDMVVICAYARPIFPSNINPARRADFPFERKEQVMF